MKKSIAIYFSVILAGLSVYGVVYSCRAAVAQRMYYRAKYTPASDDTKQVLSLCESASQLYRNNYYFCMLSAENAYYSSFSADGDGVGADIGEAQHWCDAGLALNPFRMQLRRLKTCLLARSAPAEAARYWENYVNWQYWDPANHALLVELYALTGEYDKALDSLLLIKESPYYAAASVKLQAAWQKEKALPPGLIERLPKSAQR